MAFTRTVSAIFAAGVALSAFSVGTAWAGGPDGYVEDTGESFEAVGSGYVGDSLVGFRATGATKDEAKADVVAACQAGGGVECSWDEVTNDKLCIVSIGDDGTGQVGGGAGANVEAARDNAYMHAAEGGYPYPASARILISACA